MLDGLRAAGYDLTYFRDNPPTELPVEAAQAFPLPGDFDRMTWRRERIPRCMACRPKTTGRGSQDKEPRPVRIPKQSG
jgi:hypothetical protein